MKVLVACEFSGVVRDAFIARGHDAISCDLLPSDSGSKYIHYQGDIFDIIDEGFDLMIAHPPCTYLANSSVQHLGANKDRWSDMIDGAVFFRKLLNAPIEKIAIENPIIHGYAKKVIGAHQSQVVQPWTLGHTEKNDKLLWPKGLP